MTAQLIFHTRLRRAFSSLLILLSFAQLGCAEDNRAQRSAEGDGGSGATDEPPPTPLCDGSNDIRLAVNVAGGFVGPEYTWTNPYGHYFLFVTGRCEYFVSLDSSQGIFSETLSETAALALQAKVGWDDLPAWSQDGPDQGCADSTPVAIYSPDYVTDCNCGCDDSAPAAKVEVFSALTDELTALVNRGSASTGPVDLLLVSLGDPIASAADWPLSEPAASFAINESDFYNGQLSTSPTHRFSTASDVELLRAARLASAPGAALYFTQSGVSYQAWIIDTLPEPLASKAEAFLAKSR